MSEKSFPFTDQQKSKMQHSAVKDEGRYEVSQSYMKRLENESRGSNSDSVQGTQQLEVKTEEKDEPKARGRSFWLGEGTSTDPRIHMMYRENELLEDSSSDSSSGENIFEELARTLPDVEAEIEAECKKEEKERAERRAKRSRMKHLQEPISFRLVWNTPGKRESFTMWESNEKKRKEEKKECEIKTEGGVKKKDA